MATIKTITDAITAELRRLNIDTHGGVHGLDVVDADDTPDGGVTLADTESAHYVPAPTLRALRAVACTGDARADWESALSAISDHEWIEC